jgi:hypothetical protein
MYAWWTKDYSPLDGRLKCLVYLLLFGFGWDGLIKASLEFVERCPDPMFQPAGAMQWIGLLGLERSQILSMIRGLQPVLTVSWLCAAVGIFGRAPFFVTGILAAFFYGCQQSCMGTGHGWHLPVGTLLICGCLVRNDDWSIDGWIARRWEAWPWDPRKQVSPDLSPLARKTILVVAIYTLFAGGVTKLVQSGLAWLDGVPLMFYLNHHNHPSTPLGEWLLPFLQERPGVVQGLAIGTIVLELLFLGALFWPRWRWPLVLCACGFHVGIYLVMHPKFFEQMTVYLLIVPWEGMMAMSGMERLRVMTGMATPPPPPRLCELPHPWIQRTAMAVTLALFIGLGGSLIAQREWFPLTHIPMYATYTSESSIGGIPREDFQNLPSLAKLTAESEVDELPWWAKYELGDRLTVMAWDDVGSEPVPLGSQFPRYVVHPFLWCQRASHALLQDLRETGKSGNASSRFQSIANSLREAILNRPEWMTYERFDFCLVRDSGPPTVLHSIYR